MKGQPVPVDSFKKKRDLSFVRVYPGDSVVVQGAEELYKIDAYFPPAVPRGGGAELDRSFIKFFGASVLITAIVVAITGLIVPNETIVDKHNKQEVFALLEMEQPKPEEKTKKEEPVKKPKKKKKPKPTKKDATSMAERAPDVSTNTVQKMRKRADETKANASVNSLVSVLQKNSGKPGASDQIKDQVSNIDAVAPSGKGGAFNIAGAIASLPGDDVNIARSGGGGDISTLSGSQVAGKDSAVSKLQKKKSGGKVRGTVTKMSTMARVNGSLSRAEVSRVVNSNIHAVQACYEKALMSNPGLGGKVVYGWTITTKGSVTAVSVRSSTVGSAQVTKCIAGKIRRWKFPRPKGGEVQITYPFLFRSSS